MGIRLYVEVLDYAPTTLTHREKLLLSVLAEDANDSTRRTRSSVESPKLLRQAQVSRSQLYAVIKRLIEKGALKKVGSGQKNSAAKYEICHLAPPVQTTSWCGDIDCDEDTRLQETRDESGLLVLTPCPSCHPAAPNRKGTA